MGQSGNTSKSTQQQHVVVVGAGIKGLFAARQLHKLGYHVTILERSNRAGGKIKTVRSTEPRSSSTVIKQLKNDRNPAAYAELGAMRILDCHQFTLDLLNDLKLEVIPHIEDNGSAPFVIEEQRGTVENLNLGILLAAGLLSGDISNSDASVSLTTSFNDILNKAFANAMEITSRGESLRQQNGSGQMSVSEYLAQTWEGSFLRRCAAAILDLRNGKGGMQNVEAIDEFVNILKLHSGKPLSVVGGFDLMVNCLINQLNNCAVRFLSEVIKIDDNNSNEVKTIFKNTRGEIEEIKSDAILLACPALHKINFSPQLPTEHLKLVQQKLKNECCIPAIKCVLLFEKCFWQQEKHGKVFGGTSWIGPSAVNQIYLPSASSCLDGKGYLMIYIRGEPAKRWLEYPQDIRLVKALNAIERLFPSAKDDIRRLFQDFTEEIYNEEGSGAYVLRDAEIIRDSLKPFGRIVFSPVPRGWINDTLKDGQIAVDAIQSILRAD